MSITPYAEFIRFSRCMQGNFERINLAEVLLTLHLARRNGILRLSRDEVKKSIYFVDGSIVFAHSNQKHDRLGETLLRLGKITQEEFENASREVIQKGMRLGQVLSELDYISVTEVRSSVHYQLQQIVFSLFDWDSGEYEFIERERPVFEDIMIDISTPALIINGIRNITNPAVLRRSYQSREEQILCLQTGAPRLARTDLHFEEETILACTDGTKTIESVRQLAHLAEMEFDRGLCSLLLTGLLRLGDEIKPASPQHKTSPDEIRAGVGKRWSFTTQPMAETHGGEKNAIRMKTLSEQELREFVLVTVKKFQEATDEEVLSVLPDCTVQEVKRAYDELCSHFHPPFYSSDRFLDIKDPLKSILDRATLAHDNLVARITAQLPFSEAPLDLPLPRPNAAMIPDKPAVQEKDEHPLVKEELPAGAVVEKESISDLQEKVRKEPENAHLYRRLGKRLYETGKPQESEKQYLKALELEPQNVENHMALAEFYTAMGLKLKAFKHLNIVLQLHPNHDRALEMLNLKKSKKALYEI